ncbi:MAG: DUF99 family protein [Archangiaceae bacterium]|nr:DUF99 family protein [Archangiaceae bacterium]
MTTPKRWPRRLSNVIGFDDAPHVRGSAGRVGLIGCVCSGPRLDIVLRDTIEKDGTDATDVMAELSRHEDLSHVRGVLLQGITFGGFNVIDIHRLSKTLDLPVLVVTRKKPRLELVFKAVKAVEGWQEKQALMEAAGEPEACGPVFVQRAGLSHAEAERMLEATTAHGIIPEPLRLAHLIAGGTTTGKSRGRT